MRQLILAIFTIGIIQLFVHSCANPISPTGGPKDTIPPTLLSSSPIDQALNFKEQTITLTFDERVIADKLKQSLIVTPTSDLRFKSFVKKNLVTINFENPFADSTTYTFNFFDGITDITEKNPAKNLILAFSTTSYIDSLYLYGSVKDLFTGKPQDKFTVGLYRLNDSLNFKESKPTYFTTTDETGTYRIQNVKSGRYKLFSFKDDNRNLLFDPAEEAYAFKADTFFIKESMEDSLYLSSVAINADSLKFISARPSGKYFEIRYSKPITSYKIQAIDSSYIPSKIVGEKESIRIYEMDYYTDSIKTIVSVSDSLQNKRIDTVFVNFRESSRKSDEYKATLLPKNGSSIFKDHSYSIQFNKPTTLRDSNFLQLTIDTLWKIPLHTFNYQFNSNRTSFNFKTNFTESMNRTIADSLITLYEIDSNNVDSLHLLYQSKLNRLDPKKFNIAIVPNSFISVEQDSSALLKASYKFSEPDNYGLIRVLLNTKKTHFTVQLMSSNKVMSIQENCTECVYKQIPPGEYYIRILHDQNQNGRWSYGNILEMKEPEPVYIFNETTNLRANWEVELEYTF